MTHDSTAIELTDDEIARLVEMRGGCACHVSPPCFAHTDPPTAEELAELREDDGIKCACLDRDSVQCAAIRYGMDHWGEPCECPCHQRPDEDDDEPRGRWPWVTDADVED